MNRQTILDREALEMGRDATLVDSASVGGMTFVVYDLAPVELRGVGGWQHERRWTVWKDGDLHSQASGILRVEARR